MNPLHNMPMPTYPKIPVCPKVVREIPLHPKMNSIVLNQIGRAYVCTKTRNSPLYPIEEWADRFLVSIPVLAKEPTTHTIIRSGRGITQHHAYDDKYSASTIAGNEQYYASRRLCSFQEHRLAITTNIDKLFPCAQRILNLFGDKMAVVGGFYSTKCRSDDIDFFFHSCTKEEGEYMMKVAISMITAPTNALGEPCSIKTKLIRGEHVTSVEFTISTGNNVKGNKRYYQFIHRIYPIFIFLVL